MRLEKEIKQLRRNSQKVLSQLNKVGAKQINKLASQARHKATKTVAKQIGVPVKTLKGRTYQRKDQRATAKKPIARLKVNLSPLPLIRVLESKRNRIWEGRGGIIVGQYAVQRGFVQTLKNGRRHIMQRAGKARYSIDVVKIPIRTQLTQAYNTALKDYSASSKQVLAQQFKTVFKEDLS